MDIENRMLPKYAAEDELEKLISECFELQEALQNNINSLLESFEKKDTAEKEDGNYSSKGKERIKRQGKNSGATAA